MLSIILFLLCSFFLIFDIYCLLNLGGWIFIVGTVFNLASVYLNGLGSYDYLCGRKQFKNY